MDVAKRKAISKPVRAAAPAGWGSGESGVSGLLRLSTKDYLSVFRTESAAFLVACLYLLLEYVRPQSIYAPLSSLPVTRICLLAAAALVAIERAKDKRPIYGSQWGLLGLFMFVALASMFASGNPSAGTEKLYIIVTWYIAIYIIGGSVTSERRLVFFYALFLLFSFKMSQHGFRLWVMRGFSFAREGVNGAPGWFHNSGEVGIQMCIALPMALNFMRAGWDSWSPTKRALMSIVPITMIGTVVGSSSRGAVIGVGAAFLWMMFSASGHRWKLGAWLLVLAIGLHYLLPDQFVERFRYAGQDNSSTLRLAHWAFGWKVALEHPVLGIGLGNWLPVYSRYLQETGSNVQLQVQHNVFVEALSELGFAGLAVVCLIMISIFALNRKARIKAKSLGTNELVSLSHGLDAGMVGFLVSAQFVTVLYYPYLWIALALSISLHNVTHRLWIDQKRQLAPGVTGRKGQGPRAYRRR